MAIDSLLRAFVNNWWLLKKVARYFAAIGLTPNSVSILSLFSAVLAGVLFYFSGVKSIQDNNIILLLAGIFVCLNAVLDALDGVLAREIGKASRKGDFLDHVIDRYADIFIICGIIFGGYVSSEIGIIAVIGMLFSSYMGTQAQAVGLRRMYGGLLGRADRLLIIIAATFISVLYTYPLLGWAVCFFALFCNVTALQRFFYIWRRI